MDNLLNNFETSLIFEEEEKNDRKSPPQPSHLPFRKKSNQFHENSEFLLKISKLKKMDLSSIDSECFVSLVNNIKGFQVDLEYTTIKINGENNDSEKCKFIHMYTGSLKFNGVEHEIKKAFYKQEYRARNTIFHRIIKKMIEVYPDCDLKFSHIGQSMFLASKRKGPKSDDERENGGGEINFCKKSIKKKNKGNNKKYSI